MTLKRKALICFSSFLVLSAACKHLNGNFETKDLFCTAQAGSIWDTSLVSPSLDLKAVLSQKFSFLGKGHQAFAFESEDGQYVLKLFKPHYPHIELCNNSFNFTYIPFAKGLYRLFAHASFQNRVELDRMSSLNAFSSFQNESLIEYLHLTNTSNLDTMLQIFDKNKILRTLPADSTCFLIQRKVTLLPETLHHLMKEGKTEDVELVLQRLLDLLSKRVNLRFHKPTHKFHANFGCVGLQPMQLDIGRLLTKEDLKLDPATKNPTLEDSLVKLQSWLILDFPELVPVLEKLVQQRASL